MPRSLKGIVSFVALAVVLAALEGPAFAGTRWVDGSESEALGPLAMDPLRPRGYLLDAASGELVVFDTAREEVLARFPLGSPGRDLAIDRAGSRLVVAADAALGLLRLGPLEFSEVPLPAGVVGRPMSATFHASGALFVGANTSPPGWSPRVLVYVLSPALDEVIGSFGRLVSPHPFHYPLLRTGADGDTLIALEQGLSPARIYALDVTDPAAPVVLDDNTFGPRIGANCRDLAFSPVRPEIYLACGAPSALQILPVPTFAAPTLLPSGAFPAAVAVGPLAESVVLAPWSPYDDSLYQWSATTHELLARYELADEVAGAGSRVRGLGLDRTGGKAFVAHGRWGVVEAVQVVDVARAIVAVAVPPAPRAPRRRRDWVTVVIPSLSVASGDPTDLDATALRRHVFFFGPAEALPVRRVPRTRDVDRDGDRDLVLQFDSRAAGLDCGSTTARLSVWNRSAELEAFAMVDLSGVLCR